MMTETFVPSSDEPVQATVWCAIPVYNIAGTIRDLGISCRGQLEHVVVVDDGSTDADLRELLRGLEVTVLRHPDNLGKGAAILTALRYVAERGATHLLTIDGDAQHYPEDIPRLLSRLDPDTVIIGAREEVVGTMPRSSRFGRDFSDWWIFVETGVSVRDTQSGFRVYPVKPLLAMSFCSRRYNFEVEVVTRAIWAGLKVVSVPIRVWYPSQGCGTGFPAGSTGLPACGTGFPACGTGFPACGTGFPAGRLTGWTSKLARQACPTRVSSFRPFLDNLRISLLHSRLVGRRLLPIPHRRLGAARGSGWARAAGFSPREHSRRLKPAARWSPSLKHPLRLLRELLAENTSPLGLAAAAGVGIFLGTLPLFFCHIAAILYVSVRLHLNKVMALTIQTLCVPPVVPIFCIAVGYRLRHGKLIDASQPAKLLEHPLELLYEWFLGSLIVAPLFALVMAVVVYLAARWLQSRTVKADPRPGRARTGWKAGPTAGEADEHL